MIMEKLTKEDPMFIMAQLRVFLLPLIGQQKVTRSAHILASVLPLQVMLTGMDMGMLLLVPFIMIMVKQMREELMYIMALLQDFQQRPIGQ